ncbi:MAG: MMPL family transporter, partial [Bacteroidales bacterium]|nr:MMPL family transporter [Bacteroidales bacterium]
MTALAVLCAFMIPRLNIIMEITYFLPDDSPMKIGLDKMEQDFPGMSGQFSMLSVMLEDVEDKDAEEKVLTELTGGLICMSVKDNAPYTQYQFLLTKDCDYNARREDIRRHYDDNVVVEVDLDKNIPANIMPMIVSGTVLVFVILFIMCSSLMEVVLFLLTTMIAVAINMGSNILLGSVSYMTNTMVAVLQMILSMDYSIIIMNRYRQEKARNPGDNPKAMALALKSAAPSVVSSATTTIASLLMLMFMHLKIGMDMGVVLSKGVLCSMVCNFTVLPALILFFDKAIQKSEKKIPQLPSKSLALFEIRYRAVLTVLFVGIFISAFILQKRTEVSFSAIWETEIAKYFPPQNPMILMYETAEEDVIPGILDTLQRDPMVVSCLSYPGLMNKGYTVREMVEQGSQLSPLITGDIVKAVYYAYSHPERNERMSLNEIQDLAEELSAQGLVPAEFNVKSMMAKLQPVAPKKPVTSKQPVIPAIVPAVDTVKAHTADSAMVSAVPADSTSAGIQAADSVFVAKADSIPQAAPQATEPQSEGAVAIPASFTYEEVTLQLSAKKMAEFLGIERSYINTIYRMAGRTRKPATMSPHEVASFVNNKLLNDKRYSGMVTREQKELFKTVYHRMDSAFVAGPAPSPVLTAQLEETPAAADSLLVAAGDSLAIQLPDGDLLAQNETPAEALTPVATVPKEEEEEDDDEPVVVTPLERLAEMAFSGRKYDSRTVRRALAATGI